MAFSPTDPVSAHSLWLQLRSTNRKRHHRWRSDWTPLWVLGLLLTILTIGYVLMPSNDPIEETAQQETSSQGRPVQEALAER